MIASSLVRNKPMGLSQSAALSILRETRTLSQPVVDGLGLQPSAVANWHELPEVTQQSMVDALIDRFLDAE